MLNNKEISDEIIRLSTFKILVETYEEIAASRMRRIRVSVLRSRDFMAELGAIFADLKRSYQAQVEELVKKKKQPKSGTAFRKHNDKTIAILLSANTGLYGGILQTTVGSFLDYINQYKNQDALDIAIIGRYGKTVFENINPGRKFLYFDLPDQGFSPEDTKKILSTMLAYSNIYVFHGKFISIVKQEPEMSTISAEKIAISGSAEGGVKFVFEPSLEEILVFFEQEILASLFEQSIHESELAKFASRMVTLDKATENIRERVKQVELEKRLVHHRTINKKQQDGLNAIMLTRK